MASTRIIHIFSFISNWLFSSNRKDFPTVVVQLKRILNMSGARLFYTNGLNNKKVPKSFKNILFDFFLKYQFDICVQPAAPLSHVIILSILTSAFNSYMYILMYWCSIAFILITFYFSEKFPNSFGKIYLNFLKTHSSTDAFEKLCGNPYGMIKTVLGFTKDVITNPEFLKTVSKKGFEKGVQVTAYGFATEHCFHRSKIGQVYRYKSDQWVNNGVHSSGKPFSFQPNGPSLIEKCVGRPPVEN